MLDKMQIPNGVRDLLPDDCIRTEEVMRALSRRFAACGYRPVQPPTLEYYTLYEQGNARMREQTLVKTFDRAGRILTLRPEFTTPIARIAATRLRAEERPLRLYYLGTAFDNQYDTPGKTLEFTQAGVELMGLPGAQADAEVIALAASAMQAAGLDDFLLDLGQVDFFKGLLEEAGLTLPQEEALRVSVEQKNLVAMQGQLEQYGVAEELRSRIMALPGLYGGLEVIEEAAGLSASPRCHRALENLRCVCGLLTAYDLQERICIDLGMVHSIEYYTGIIFRGISGEVGAPILSGGRYDGLMGDFGVSCPATGFALGVERLMGAMNRETAQQRAVDIVAAARGGFTGEALREVERLRSQGYKVELCYEDEPEAVRARAAQWGAEVRFL